MQWLFLNSSISEGLPLALGEAALTGAPVVCTDVGASSRILTDHDDGSCFSAIVAPNDPRALARAEIELLAMIGKWSVYADDAADLPIPQLSDKPSPDKVAQITKRMFDKSESRSTLGMRSRAIIQKSFAGDRYLREHEQMLWIGKARKNMRDGILATEALGTAARPISDAVTTAV
jgi:glycosyltransferase involved in cell wall biosynthesis